MKKIIAPLMIALFVFTASCGEETTSSTDTGSNTNNTSGNGQAKYAAGSPEEFATILAGYVIDSNYAGIESLIINHEEMKNVISNSTVTPQGKEAAISHIDTEIGKMKQDMKNGLHEIRTKGSAGSIVWSLSKYRETQYTIAEPTGYQMMQMTCVIECNGAEYKFSVTDVVKTENGWRMGGKMMYGDRPAGK